ncbi:unnamed protein product [Cylindrotheca closterium]|uniref:Galectin n=1 Tax=Cylindrotheca closterium TaxID=2856 RepID=A0AAD2GEB2_9STRA|nr:unnamed protein product [Cylindrotheca closterium]
MAGERVDSKAASSWKNASAANQAKFHLLELPEDFKPTKEEEALVNMYQTIRQFERQAARLKEQKAREKLAAKETEFKQSQASKQKKRRRKRENVPAASGDDVSDGSSAEEDYSSDEEQDEQTLHDRRTAKLDALRDEVDEAKKAMVADAVKQETLRKSHLETKETDISTGPSLKRKKLEDTTSEGGLLSNMKIDTPPHEFSERLNIKPWKGKTLFPATPDETQWTPPEGVGSPNVGAFLVELPEFDITKAQNGTGNNTIVIKFHAPNDSKRFSINIAGPGHDDFNSVLFHFNPRQFERGGQLVVNDKQEGIWGQSIALPLSQVPLIFGQEAITLQIQINGDGFDVFMQDKHCVRLEHRKELPSKPCSLFLQFPSCDDYGSPENWMVYRAWWGNQPVMAKGDLSDVAGVNSFNAVHPRKLFVSGLSKISTQTEVDIRRAELERAFRKYGGARGVTCIVPTNTTFAFVEMESDRMADLALSEMSSKYRLNRARRSRHEALQEERAAKEAGGKSEDKAW